MNRRDFLEDFVDTSLWSVVPAKHRFRYKKDSNAGMKESHRLALTMGGVIDRSLDDTDGLQSSDYGSYQIFEKGDLAFKLIDLQNIRTSRVGLVPRRGIMSPAYIRLTPTSDDVFPEFYYWYFYSAYLGNIFNGMGGGIRQNLSQTELLEFPVPKIPVSDQISIARFLDRETARIDGLIEKKGRFIALLQEKRAALITHAVTKGVTQAAHDVHRNYETKSDWTLSDVRLDQLFEEVKDLVPLDGIELLTPSVVHGVVPQASLGMRPQQALRENYRVNLARPDDFVISLSSHAHGIEYCGMSGGISPDYTLLRPTCDPRLIPFLRYALKSKWIIFQMGAFKTGVRMGLRLQWNKVRFCRIGVPSPDAAGPIAAFLDGETARIDALITKTERSIELLREKRSALITAAVTGKIDVRGSA